MWEIAENLHRLDLTKEQRDEHIRRYGELKEAARLAAENQVQQNAAPEIGYRKPPPQQKGIAREIAEETGLSVDTVRRALNPKPVAEVIPLAVRSQEDVILMQANAVVAAWNLQASSLADRQEMAGLTCTDTRCDEAYLDRVCIGA